jgi:hypothetical protein
MAIALASSAVARPAAQEVAGAASTTDANHNARSTRFIVDLSLLG